jgi:hypothetical protein
VKGYFYFVDQKANGGHAALKLSDNLDGMPESSLLHVVCKVGTKQH